MAPDRGSLEKETDLPGTLPQMLCLWEEGYSCFRNNLWPCEGHVFLPVSSGKGVTSQVETWVFL